MDPDNWKVFVDAAQTDIAAALDGEREEAEEHLNDAKKNIERAIDLLDED